ncbi:Uncharacterized protein TCM_022922 [Theobroma cacao]|uniref:Uncharacterized protein n=1 Tax=Theobroma cacao TaxID=3641 RepID=A0A061EUF9_THECC|nr:Uncharacterized protein TCM_022922 [Theobroma cacao]
MRGAFPKLDDSALNNLTKPVEENEVKEALFEMKPLKAPGIDGFPALFFHSQWQVEKKSMLKNLPSTTPAMYQHLSLWILVNVQVTFIQKIWANIRASLLYTNERMQTSSLTWKRKSQASLTVVIPSKTYKKIKAHYNIHKPGASTFWTAITQSWPQFKPNIKWAMGNEISIRLWTDQWLDDIILVNVAKSIGIEIIDESSVKEYVTTEGEWDLDRVVNLIPPKVCNRLHETIPPTNNVEQDKPFWAYTPSGIFTMSSAYKVLRGLSLSNTSLDNKIWKLIRS